MLMKETGLPLDYFDNLPLNDLADVLSYLSATAKGFEKKRELKK